MSTLEGIDHSLFWAINNLSGVPAIDTLMLYGTDLGTYVGVTIALIAYLIHTPRPIPWRRVSLVAALVTGVGLMNSVIKYLAQRDRPPLIFPNKVHILGPLLTLYSFPSGHTVTAFSVVAFLLVVDRPLGFVALPIACFVGFTRVYVGAHFPSDVLFGAAFGFFGVYPLAKRVWAK